MGELDHPGRERLRRLAGDEAAVAKARETGRTTAIAPTQVASDIGKRTLAESWGAGIAAPVAAPAVFTASMDAARRHLGTLSAAHESSDHYASSEAAQQLRVVLVTAHAAASPEQQRVLAELEAEAAPLLAAAFAPSRAAIDEARAGEGRTAWNRDVTAWRASRDRAGAAPAVPVQRRSAVGQPALDGRSAQQVAAPGVANRGDRLPYFDRIQRAFGRHDISGVTVHTGTQTDEAARALGARAYTIGERVALRTGGVDLHTVAHEAAHAVQQRSGVQLAGGIDQGASDPYERHADLVADAVVADRSAEALLDAGPSGATAAAGSGERAVQRKRADAGAEAADSPPPDPAISQALIVLDAVQLNTELAISAASLPQISSDLHAVRSELRPGNLLTLLSPLGSLGLSVATSNSADEVTGLLEVIDLLTTRIAAIRADWTRILDSASALARTGNSAAIVVFKPNVDQLKARLGSVERLRVFENQARSAIVEVRERASTRIANHLSRDVAGESSATDAFAQVTGIHELSMFWAGAAVGTFEGAGKAVLDTYNMSQELIKELTLFVLNVVRGEGGAAVRSAVGQISGFLASCPNLPAAIGAALAARWTASTDFAKGELVGEIAGYIAATVVIAAFTEGATVELELMTGTGELAEIVRALMKVTDPLNALRPLKKAAKTLPAELVAKIRAGSQRAGIGARLVAGRMQMKVSELLDLLSEKLGILGPSSRFDQRMLAAMPGGQMVELRVATLMEMSATKGGEGTPGGAMGTGVTIEEVTIVDKPTAGHTAETPETTSAAHDVPTVTTSAIRTAALAVTPTTVDAVIAQIKSTGKLTGDLVQFDKVIKDAKLGQDGALGELEAVQRWTSEGRMVEVLTEKQTVPNASGSALTNPDYRLDGKITEVKSRTRRLDSRWVKTQISEASEQIASSGMAQSGAVELQLRGEGNNDVSFDEVERQVRGALKVDRGRGLDRVTVRKDGALIGEWSRQSDGTITRNFPK